MWCKYWARPNPSSPPSGALLGRSDPFGSCLLGRVVAQVQDVAVAHSGRRRGFERLGVPEPVACRCYSATRRVKMIVQLQPVAFEFPTDGGACCALGCRPFWLGATAGYIPWNKLESTEWLKSSSSPSPSPPRYPVSSSLIRPWRPVLEPARFAKALTVPPTGARATCSAAWRQRSAAWRQKRQGRLRRWSYDSV